MWKLFWWYLSELQWWWPQPRSQRPAIGGPFLTEPAFFAVQALGTANASHYGKKTHFIRAYSRNFISSTKTYRRCFQSICPLKQPDFIQKWLKLLASGRTLGRSPSWKCLQRVKSGSLSKLAQVTSEPPKDARKE